MKKFALVIGAVGGALILAGNVLQDTSNALLNSAWEYPNVDTVEVTR